MERRDLVLALGLAAASGAATQAAAQGAGAGPAASMHPAKYKALVEATAKCVGTGKDCLRHCFGMLAMNDTSMSGCADSAYQVVAACDALQSLAAVNSTHVPPLARAVADICVSCQRECEKFPNVAECKACGDACRACAEECRRAAG